MSSTVRFKFKSAKAHSAVNFDGDFIRVADLKLAIFNQKNLQFGENFDLEIKNEQTTETYKTESELIPRNSSVEVRRIPGLVPGGILAQQAMARKNERYADTPNPRGAASASQAAASMSSAPVSGVSEGERLASLVEVSGKDYDKQGAPYNARGPAPGERPRFSQHNIHQATVACRRCGDRGHTLRECPILPPPGTAASASTTADADKRDAPAIPGGSVVLPGGEGSTRVRLMKPTGIPTSSLAPLQGAGPTGTALVTQGGQIMVMRPNEDEFARQTAGLMRARELAKARKNAKKSEEDDEDEDQDNESSDLAGHKTGIPKDEPDGTEPDNQDPSPSEDARPASQSAPPNVSQPTSKPATNLIGQANQPNQQSKQSQAPQLSQPSRIAHPRHGRIQHGQGRPPPQQQQKHSSHSSTGNPGFMPPGFVPGMPVLPPLPPGALGQQQGAPSSVQVDPRLFQQQQAYFQAVGAWMAQQQRHQQHQGNLGKLNQSVNQTGPFVTNHPTDANRQEQAKHSGNGSGLSGSPTNGVPMTTNRDGLQGGLRSSEGQARPNPGSEGQLSRNGHGPLPDRSNSEDRWRRRSRSPGNREIYNHNSSRGNQGRRSRSPPSGGRHQRSPRDGRGPDNFERHDRGERDSPKRYDRSRSPNRRPPNSSQYRQGKRSRYR